MFQSDSSRGAMRRPPRPVDGGWLDLTVGRRRSSIAEVRLAVGAEHCQARNWRGRAYLGISQHPGFLAQDSWCHPAAGSAITRPLAVPNAPSVLTPVRIAPVKSAPGTGAGRRWAFIGIGPRRAAPIRGGDWRDAWRRG